MGCFRTATSDVLMWLTVGVAKVMSATDGAVEAFTLNEMTQIA